jgi:hypothetical protein
MLATMQRKESVTNARNQAVQWIDFRSHSVHAANVAKLVSGCDTAY